MTPDGLLEVLVVGCGNIAGDFDAAREDSAWPLTHAGAYRRHGGFKMIACVDPDSTRRQAFMTRWDVAEGYTSIEELVKQRRRFDVVSICSPTALHAGHIDQAIDLSPRLIFCEKPVTPDAASTARLVQACEQRGIALAINHTRRWAPDVVRLGEELASGQWGTVRAAVGHYNKGLLNNGGHLVDLLHLLLGSLELKWAGAPVRDFWPNDASIPALLYARGGVPVHLNVAHSADYAFFELQLITSVGVLAMEDGGLHWRVRKAVPSVQFAGYQTLDAGKRIHGEYEQAMLCAADNLHAHLLAGVPLASTGHTALEAQRVCETIWKAALAGHASVIQDLTP